MFVTYYEWLLIYRLNPVIGYFLQFLGTVSEIYERTQIIYNSCIDSKKAAAEQTHTLLGGLKAIY